MTLGSAAVADVRLIVRCRECGRQVEPDPAEMAARYGAGTPVPDWREPAGLFQMRQPAGRAETEETPVKRPGFLTQAIGCDGVVIPSSASTVRGGLRFLGEECVAASVSAPLSKAT
jgi:hypothetical protein